ncbi:MAG: biotin transporter BioY [Lachnospiraceae bacterium]|nr:biotin transporter BioY [Lachnospiraceae bacterium]
MNKTRDLSYMALFTALITAGAFIKIPIPVVPFTLQYLFTMLAGILLGAKRGAFSVLCYLILGLLGLPIFAQGGGIAYVLNPTFGYLIGFVLGAYVTGRIARGVKSPSLWRLLAADFAGLLVVYACGMLYYWAIVTFYVGSGIGIGTLFLYCFVLAVPGDVALCFLAAFLGKRLIPVLSTDISSIELRKGA